MCVSPQKLLNMSEVTERVNVTAFDKGKQKKLNKKKKFPVRKKICSGKHSNLHPPALVFDHHATSPPRIFNKVKFCYFIVDMRKKFTSE